MAEKATVGGSTLVGIFSLAEKRALESIDLIKGKDVPLQQRLTTLQTSNKWQELKSKKVSSSDILKTLDKDLYDALHKNAKYLKSYRRFLNTILTTDKDFLDKNGLVAKLQELEIPEGGINDEYLTNLKRLGDNWDSNISFFRESGNQFRTKLNTVGHHFIAPSTIRDELVKLGFNPKHREFREALIKELKDRGFKLGEEVMAYIDPFAHKVGDFKGIMAQLFPEEVDKGKKLAFKDPKFRPLFEAVENLYAHSVWSGGTTGTKLKPGFVDPNDVKGTAGRIEPLLEIPQSAGNTALLFDEALRGVRDDFLNNRSKYLDAAGNIDQNKLLARLSQTARDVPLPDVERLIINAALQGHEQPISRIRNISRNFELPNLVKDYKKALSSGIYNPVGNGFSAIVTPLLGFGWNKLRNIDISPAGVIDKLEVFTPTKEQTQIAKEQGITSQEFLNPLKSDSYGRKVLTSVGTLKAMEGSMSLVGRFAPASAAPVLGAFGSFMQHPIPLGIAGLAALNQLDENVFDGQGKQLLEAVAPDPIPFYNKEGKKAAEENLNRVEEEETPGSNLRSFAMPF